MRFCLSALIFLAACFATAVAHAAAPATRRVAIVAGVADYGGRGDLPNPLRDARAMGETLVKLGFEVHLLLDPRSGAIEQAFGDLAAGGAPVDTLAFYFAGHGASVGGQSVLALNNGGPRKLNLAVLPLSRVLEAAHRLAPRATLIMLDACRTDIGAHLPASRAGLAPPPRATGTFFAYAAAPGDVAFDTPSKGLSFFTLALVDELLVPNQDIGVVMRKVRERVSLATGGRQLPWSEDSLVGPLVVDQAPAAPQLFALYGLALKGEAAAERELGLAILNGQGIARDEERGLALLGQAAAQSDVPALLALGAYEAARDRNALLPAAKARQWYRQAAALGSGEAWFRLAELDRKASPQDKPPSAATREAYAQAAAHGNLEARARLQVYALMFGAEQDRGAAIPALRQIAAAGSLLAEAALGAAYSEPGHKDTDFAEADFWLAKAVHEGSTDALLTQAKIFGLGRGRPVDKPKAYALTLQAARAGDPLAMLLVGRMQQQGDGTTPDRAAAVDWFRRATEAGEAEAFADLGFCYEGGLGVDRNSAQAVAFYRQGAALRDPVATRYLAVMYENGTGVRENIDKAIAFYQRAADLGDARARASLAVLAINGLLTSAPDFMSGAGLLKQAVAHSDDADYIVKLAQMTEKGKGMPPDPSGAAKLYARAAAFGSAEAASELAAMTLEGVGVARDEAKAESLFRKAAEAGDAVAYANLAVILRKRGRAANAPAMLAEAGRWSRRGAEAGNPEAMEMYASDLLTGDEGFAQDVKQGLDWEAKAMALGEPYALRKLKTMAAGKLDVPRSWQDDALLILVKAAVERNDPAAIDALQQVFQVREGIDMVHGTRTALEARLDGPQHGLIALLLGLGFQDGRFSGKPDGPTAKRYFEMAAAAGEPDAWRHLGELELDRLVPDAAPEKAFAFFRKGADAGDAGALNDLGFAYRKGVGTPVDDVKAYDAFQRAAVTGYAPAMYDLALCLQRGIGTAKAPEEAERWYERAIAGGVQSARLGLATLLLNAAPDERDYSRALFHLFRLAVEKRAEAMTALEELCRNAKLPQWVRLRAIAILAAARTVAPGADAALQRLVAARVVKRGGNRYGLTE